MLMSAHARSHPTQDHNTTLNLQGSWCRIKAVTHTESQHYAVILNNLNVILNWSSRSGRKQSGITQYTESSLPTASVIRFEIHMYVCTP